MNCFSGFLETIKTRKFSPIFLATGGLTSFPLYCSEDSCWLQEHLFFERNHCIDKGKYCFKLVT